MVLTFYLSIFLMTPTENAMQRPLIAVLIASAFLTLNAPAAQAADLIQVYQQALANDATYASARAALAAGQQKTAEGRAGLLPTIQASGSNTRNTGNEALNPALDGGLLAGGSTTQPISQSLDYHVNTYTVSLSQPLYNWAAWQQYQQGKLLQANAEANFRSDHAADLAEPRLPRQHLYRFAVPAAVQLGRLAAVPAGQAAAGQRRSELQI